MKIAVFGGSFDPPHKGHNAVVMHSLKNLDIDKLIIMPTFISPFKDKFLADEKQRLFWIKKIWGSMKKIEISSFEIDQKKPVPSIISVNHILKLYTPEKLYFIIGADHLSTLHLWHNYQELCKKVEFVIAQRDNIEIPKKFKSLNTQINISSTLIRTTLEVEEVCDEIKEEVKEYYLKLQKIDTIKIN